jgi:hypothetical protein
VLEKTRREERWGYFAVDGDFDPPYAFAMATKQPQPDDSLADSGKQGKARVKKPVVIKGPSKPILRARKPVVIKAPSKIIERF